MREDLKQAIRDNNERVAAKENAHADAISALKVGDGVTFHGYSDSYACTLVKKTAKTLVARRDKATLLNRKDLKFHVGGFAAHCSNQEKQEYSYEANENGEEFKATLREWTDQYGFKRRRWVKSGTRLNERGGSVAKGRHEFYDYNF